LDDHYTLAVCLRISNLGNLEFATWYRTKLGDTNPRLISTRIASLSVFRCSRTRRSNSYPNISITCCRMARSCEVFGNKTLRTLAQLSVLWDFVSRVNFTGGHT